MKGFQKQKKVKTTGSTMRKVTKENDIFSQLEMHFKI